MIENNENMNLSTIHFIGIGGIGLSAIAKLCLHNGYNVQGSDIKNSDTLERLVNMGIKVFVGHNSNNINTKEKSNGTNAHAGLFGKVLSAGKRAISGESIFLTHFTNSGEGKKRVAFSSPYPGKIIPCDLSKIGNEITCQKNAFLCAAFGTEVSMKFRKKVGAGFFGGEGFILQHLSGDGLVFMHACGTIIKKELNNSTILVDTGCLVAFTSGVDYDNQRTGGLKSSILGGEGFFLAKLSGTGTVYLQSLPFSKLANKILECSASN